MNVMTASIDDKNPEALPRRRFNGRGTPHRLVVMGLDVSDIVASVGAYVCDRTMAGWEVCVLARGCRDDRPLAVLGVNCGQELKDFRPSLSGEVWPDELLVSTSLYSSERWVQKYVVKVFGQPDADVVFWGEGPRTSEDTDWTEAIAHQASRAAHAFKAHAVAIAMGTVPSTGRSEHLSRLKRLPVTKR